MSPPKATIGAFLSLTVQWPTPNVEGKVLVKSLQKVGAVSQIAKNLAIKRPVILNLNLNVTNFCNQACPFCNADMMGKTNPLQMTFENFKLFYKRLKPYGIPSLTISGGEPTLCKDLPKILEYSVGKFPMGITLNTNLYAPWNMLKQRIEPALRHDIRIGVSFDGFGHVADELRGAENVAERVEENIAQLTAFKKEIGSKSVLNLHTVMNDKNLPDMKRIFDVSDRYGWTHTIAPVNEFFYLDEAVDKPIISRAEELNNAVTYFRGHKMKTFQTNRFLEGVPHYANRKTPKICPFLTERFKVAKVFVEPDGMLTLCDRGKGIGNLKDMTLEEMLHSKAYQESVEDFKKCGGCWLTCFVNVELAMGKRFINKVIEEQNPGKSLSDFPWLAS